MTLTKKQFIMGAVMGPMMLIMAHDQIMEGAAVPTWPAIMFIGAHVALGTVVILGGLFAARLSLRMRGWIDRLHRPTLAHVGTMFLGALISAGLVHIVLHGMA